MSVLDAIMGLVVNLLTAPCAKRSVPEHLQQDVYFPAAEHLQLRHFYRALDFLEDAKDDLEEELYCRTRDMLNRRVDLVLYDSTSGYVDGNGDDDLLQYGYSRDLKHVVNLRPLHHWAEPRIKAHVLLSVLSYFIERWDELRTGLPWREVFMVLSRVQAIKVELKTGALIRRTKLTSEQKLLYRNLDADEPPLIL